MVGTDFVCASPLWDVTGNTPRVAAVMMFEQLCLVAEARSIHGSPYAKKAGGAGKKSAAKPKAPKG